MPSLSSGLQTHRLVGVLTLSGVNRKQVSSTYSEQVNKPNAGEHVLENFTNPCGLWCCRAKIKNRRFLTMLRILCGVRVCNRQYQFNIHRVPWRQLRLVLLHLLLAVASYGVKKARQVRKRRLPSGLTQYEEHFVLSVYIESKFNVRLAAQRLRELHPAGQSFDWQQAERIVEDMFIRQDDEFVQNMSCPADARTKQIRDQARSFLAELEVFSWVESQNVAHGVAPSSLSARCKFDDLRSELGSAVGEMAPKGARQWVRRWRRRHPATRHPHRAGAAPRPAPRGHVPSRASAAACRSQGRPNRGTRAAR
mgnify:CR=1 FL=1